MTFTVDLAEQTTTHKELQTYDFAHDFTKKAKGIRYYIRKKKNKLFALISAMFSAMLKMGLIMAH